MKLDTKEIKKLLILGIPLLITIAYICYKMIFSGLTGSTKIITYLTIMLLAFITFGFSFYVYEKKNVKIEKVYLVMGLVFCTLYCICMPVSKGHDETIHGYRIYEYAEGNWISDGKTVNLEKGVFHGLQDKAKYKNIFEQEKGFYDINPGERETRTSRIASYSPITYLPQITGILVGKVVTNNSVIQLYIARIFNILSCVIMVYCAIKLIPFGKSVLFLIAMIPITIEGFCTLSADGITMAASMLWIASIFKFTYGEDKKIGIKQLLLLLLLAIVVAVSKTIYITLLLLLFMIPKEKFKNIKYKIGGICTIGILATLINAFWFFIGTSNNAGMVATSNTPIQFILENPIAYLGKVIYSIVVRFPNLMLEMFGGYLEWNENVKIEIVGYLLFAALAILFTRKTNKEFKLKKSSKIIMIIVILVTIILVYTSMFMGWSRMDSPYIMGVQGRYLLPILPIILFLVSRKFIEEEKSIKYLNIFMMYIQIFALINIVLFHI